MGFQQKIVDSRNVQGANQSTQRRAKNTYGATRRGRTGHEHVGEPSNGGGEEERNRTIKSRRRREKGSAREGVGGGIDSPGWAVGR
jgi:hypothetical protein